MKAEHNDLKRTSALLINNISNEDRILEFFKITEELKEEILEKNRKVVVELKNSRFIIDKIIDHRTGSKI